MKDTLPFDETCVDCVISEGSQRSFLFWNICTKLDESIYLSAPNSYQRNMLNQFRIRYPQGSLMSDLVKIDREKYIVRTLIQNDGITLATGLAAATTVEQAEDRSRERALAALLSPTSGTTDEAALHSTSAVVSDSHPSPNGGFDQVNASPAVEQGTASSDAAHLERQQNQAPAAYASQPEEDPAALSNSHTNGGSRGGEVAEDLGEPASDATSQPTLSVSPEPSQQPLDYSPPDEYSSFSFEEEPDAAPAKQWMSSTSEQTDSSLGGPIDFSDIIAKTNVEMKRLGWTSEQGRKYLLETYGKRSRQLLSDEELLDFLNHLERL